MPRNINLMGATAILRPMPTGPVVPAATGMPSDAAGQTVMLDIVGFTQTTHERGYRQGYLSGLADACGEFMRQMRSMRQQQRGRPVRADPE